MVEGFQKVASASEIPSGKVKIAKFMGQEIAIANVEGQFYAFSNRCTHQGGPVGRGKLTGFAVQCPWHGSKFDIRTGAVLAPPAQTPLPTFAIKVEGGAIWVKNGS